MGIRNVAELFQYGTVESGIEGRRAGTMRGTNLRRKSRADPLRGFFGIESEDKSS
jgi:hypothetical protein